MAVMQEGAGEDAARMVRALRFANYTRVGESLGVTRSAVARWAKGRQVTPWNLQQVEQLLGEQKEAPRPDWAEELLVGIAAIRQSQEASSDLLAALAAVRSRPPRSDGGREGDHSPPRSDGRHGQ